jgi:hypothetical protein
MQVGQTMIITFSLSIVFTNIITCITTDMEIKIDLFFKVTSIAFSKGAVILYATAIFSLNVMGMLYD